MSNITENMNIDADLPLVQKAKDGDQKAFTQLVTIHKRRIFGLILKMVRNSEDGQDLSQETFVKAYRGLEDFKGESSFKTWITKIAINLCINFNRKRNLRSFVSLFDLAQPLVASDSPVREQERNQISCAIDQAVLRLPPKQKTVFVLRYYQKLSYEEISQITGKSVGGLKANYFQAIRKLRKFLSGYLSQDAFA